MRSLIVDDLPTNRKLLRVRLESEGHSTVEASDGVEALQVLGRERWIH
jgi:CheY-like chemotaxis protein